MRSPTPHEHRRTAVMRWLLLVVLSLLPALAAADRDDHVRARELQARGEILPLSVILEHTRRVQPGRVLEVELERDDGIWTYELEVLDPQGRVWELRLDARNGRLLERERED